MIPKRVMIIGGPGSGKSTLATRMGAALGLPVYHMDREVFWLPGWQERAKDDQRRQIERIVALDAWVFEGNNSSSFSLREARADMLVWLDVPLWLRLVRVIRRSVRQNGQTRADMARDCPERLSMLPDFLWFILSTARSGRRTQGAFFDATRLMRYRLRSVSEVEAFVAGLGRCT